VKEVIGEVGFSAARDRARIFRGRMRASRSRARYEPAVSLLADEPTGNSTGKPRGSELIT
jgi:hypothetical protein